MSDKPAEKESRVKVKKLKLNKETIEELAASEAKQVQGGVGTLGQHCQTAYCPPPPTEQCDSQVKGVCGGTDRLCGEYTQDNVCGFTN